MTTLYWMNSLRELKRQCLPDDQIIQIMTEFGLSEEKRIGEEFKKED